MTRNSSTHVSLVCLQAHERSTSMMCWPFELAAYPPSMFNADGKSECRHVQINTKTQTTSDYI